MSNLESSQIIDILLSDYDGQLKVNVFDIPIHFLPLNIFSNFIIMKTVLFCLLYLVTVEKCFGLKIDTTQYVILPLEKRPTVFPKGSTNTTLSAKELDEIEQVLTNAVSEYNLNLWSSHPTWIIKDSSHFVINLWNYNRQYIAIINSKKEKEVWINFFQKIYYEDGIPPDLTWREHVVIVDDGGNGFYNVKVNLSSKKYYDLKVNGR